MKRVIIVACLPGLLLLAGCENEFRKTCEEELGGVYKEDTKIIQTIAYDSKGRPIFGTSTVTVKFCLKDGEVVMQG